MKNNTISLDNRIVQEIARIKAEVGLTAKQMAAPLSGLSEQQIDLALSALVSEAGGASVKSFCNDTNAWSRSMNDAVRALVTSIHTVDSITFHAIADRDEYLFQERNR